jgi:two-component system sensor histidine kinase KdpD
MAIRSSKKRIVFDVSVGAVGCVVIAITFGAFYKDVNRAVVALLLVVPVVIASEIGGRVAGPPSVGVATLALSFTLPPLGSPNVELADDLIALVAFAGVTLVVSLLVSTRVEALASIAEQRRAILRSVSHDLRTPLSTIRAVATDLRSFREYDQADRIQLLDLVIDETDRLDRLVANLLSMSRIEAGWNSPQLTAVDVREVVEDCATRMQRLFESRVLRIDIPDDLPLIRADYVQFEQILTNLLENIARHTPPDTIAEVSARADGSEVVLTVTDDGPGISPERRRAIERPGVDAGFGLAICSAFVQQIGGTIRIEEGPSGGTRVGVRVPRYV